MGFWPVWFIAVTITIIGYIVPSDPLLFVGAGMAMGAWLAAK